MQPSYLSSLVRARARLGRLDNRPIGGSRDEIRMFMIVRNEELRLPFLLGYYQRLGVDRLFVVENGSTDGTLEILLAQERTHVFQTFDSYVDHWCWMEYLLEVHGRGRWCVVVDADEMLVFPRGDELSLRDLCGYFDAQGTKALYCLLLDLYSDRPFEELTYRPYQDPLSLPWYFDRSLPTPGTWDVVNRKTGKDFHCEACRGGVRLRTLGLASAQTKIPLLRYGPGTYLIQGMHGADDVTFSPVRGAVLHLKYLQDFVGRVRSEAERKEHWNDALEYRGTDAVDRRRSCPGRTTQRQDRARPETPRRVAPGQDRGKGLGRLYRTDRGLHRSANARFS